VHMKPLAGPAVEVVRRGFVKFVPERFTKLYMNWMENIRPWCISRQLWWGHRIPAYYCDDCGEMTVAVDPPERCPVCGGNVEQDPDVLDTWFSSALWPYSTLGWPENTPDLEYFYPTSVLVTAYDIIFFWVARMIFTGLHFMGEKPFHHVLLNGLVLDQDGKKMSRSKGTGVDPIEAIEEFGADALRFALLTGTAMGQDSRVYREKIESARNFCNKLWNASRFVTMNLADDDPKRPPADLDIADRWILSRLGEVTDSVESMLSSYEIGEAAKLLYDFVWSEFCDWYIEMSKPRLMSQDEAARHTARHVLWRVLEHTLRLLHPYIPFITEEIWQSLPHDGESIMVSQWPVSAGEADADAEEQMQYVMEVTRAVRNLRAELGVAPSQKVSAIVLASPKAERALSQARGYVERLSALSSFELREQHAEKPKKALASVVTGAEVFCPFEGLIDIEREVERLSKDLGAVGRELERVRSRLENKGFLTNAPEEVVQKERGRLGNLEERAQKIRDRLELLRQ